jgi:hypothetical protein
MNDITQEYHIYADDVQLYISGRYNVMDGCVARLNDNLAHTHRWSMSNSLLLNPDKMMFICCSRTVVASLPVVVAGI